MPGQQELVGAFEIAGIACRVECREVAFWNLLCPRYGDFASVASPQFSLRVELSEPPPDDVAAQWSGSFARIGESDGLLSIEGAGFRGAFDERSGQGWIVQPLDPSPFETFLTAIYASRLLSEGGFFLHAAAIVGTDGASVFFGPSGSGKTTVAELVGEGVISDEIVAIKRDGDRFRVSGVPWRGQQLSAPLAGLFRLRKAGEVRFTRLSPVAAVRQLLGSVFFSRGADLREVGRFFEIGGEMARAVPCYEMHFRPDLGFWRSMPGRGQEGMDGHSL
jgi:hypothetical protein